MAREEPRGADRRIEDRKCGLNLPTNGVSPSCALVCSDLLPKHSSGTLLHNGQSHSQDTSCQGNSEPPSCHDTKRDAETSPCPSVARNKKLGTSGLAPHLGLCPPWERERVPLERTPPVSPAGLSLAGAATIPHWENKMGKAQNAKICRAPGSDFSNPCPIQLYSPFPHSATPGKGNHGSNALPTSKFPEAMPQSPSIRSTPVEGNGSPTGLDLLHYPPHDDNRADPLSIGVRRAVLGRLLSFGLHGSTNILSGGSPSGGSPKMMSFESMQHSGPGFFPNLVEVDELSFPIYAPTTRKLSPPAIQQICDSSSMAQGDKTLISNWLTCAKWHSSLLRCLPKRQRPVFRNSLQAKDIEALVSANIIRRVAPTEAPTASECKCFTIVEHEKRRRRFIVEPRALNLAYRASESFQCPKLALPHLDDIVELVAQSKLVEVIDFRSFYYQVELDASIRPFYRLWIHQPHQEPELFELRVLPQGGCHSVWVAQQLTLAQMRLLGIPSKSLVYIDNVYIPRDSPVPSPQNKLKEHCKFEIGENYCSSTLPILGLFVDCTKKTVDIKASTRNRLLRELRTVADVLSAFGTVNFCARALHRPMADYPQAMKFLSHVCRDFLLGTVELQTPLDRDPKALSALLHEATTWGPVRALCRPQAACLTVFTDASDTGGCFVVVDEKGLGEVSAWKWPVSLTTASINLKELLAIKFAVKFLVTLNAKTETRLHKHVRIVTDSQVASHILIKGCSKSPTLNKEVRYILGQIQVFTEVEWIHSGNNAADAGSRNHELDGSHIETSLFPEGEGRSIPLWYAKFWQQPSV